MREFHLTPRPLRFTTGKPAEHWIVTPLLLAALGLLAWRDTGGDDARHPRPHCDRSAVNFFSYFFFFFFFFFI